MILTCFPFSLLYSALQFIAFVRDRKRPKSGDDIVLYSASTILLVNFKLVKSLINLLKILYLITARCTLM